MVLAVLALALSTVLNLSVRAGQPLGLLAHAGPDHTHVHGDGVAHSHAPIQAAALDEGGLIPDSGGPTQTGHEHEPLSPCSLLSLATATPSVASVRNPALPSVPVRWPDELDTASASPGGLERPPRPLSKT